MPIAVKRSLKRSARRILPRQLYEGAKEALFSFRLADLERRQTITDAAVAHALYGDSAIMAEAPAMGLTAFELTIQSQNGEDGILLHLLGHQRDLTRTIVEIGAGNGVECNSANLILNWGWSGLLIDGDPQEVEFAQRFYRSKIQDHQARVRNVRAFVTTENVNLLVDGYADADVLSIDIDGNDYWVWDAITIDPPIVVIEYNASFGPTASLTIPYDREFERFTAHSSGYYHGASLVALTRLAKGRGYELAGGDSQGVNAFFIRADRVSESIPLVSPEDAWRPHAVRCREMSHAAQQEVLLQAGPFVTIDE